MMSLAERLRRDRGLTQKEIAKAAGMAPMVVGKIENWRRVRSSSYDRLAAFLGVPVRDLLRDFAENCDAS